MTAADPVFQCYVSIFLLLLLLLFFGCDFYSSSRICNASSNKMNCNRLWSSLWVNFVHLTKSLTPSITQKALKQDQRSAERYIFHVHGNNCLFLGNILVPLIFFCHFFPKLRLQKFCSETNPSRGRGAARSQPARASEGPGVALFLGYLLLGPDRVGSVRGRQDIAHRLSLSSVEATANLACFRTYLLDEPFVLEMWEFLQSIEL